MTRKDDAYSVIGTGQPRLDGPDKAAGRSPFTDDVALPGMLYGKIVRSAIPRGKLISVDISRAQRVPGVKAIITARDTNGPMAGPDQPVLRENTINCFGDEIAADGCHALRGASTLFSGLLGYLGLYDELPVRPGAIAGYRALGVG